MYKVLNCILPPTNAHSLVYLFILRFNPRLRWICLNNYPFHTAQITQICLSKLCFIIARQPSTVYIYSWISEGFTAWQRILCAVKTIQARPNNVIICHGKITPLCLSIFLITRCCFCTMLLLRNFEYISM